VKVILFGATGMIGQGVLRECLLDPRVERVRIVATDQRNDKLREIPMHGIVSRTRLDRVVYAILAPIYPVLKALLSSVVTTTDNVSKAMLLVAADTGAGAEVANKRVLENRDINELVAG
jgi:nucleoside-diphosphate-sugar epimerase